MGVPQEIILSVTLLVIEMKSLLEVLRDDMHGSLYVDDFDINPKKKMNSVERQLQLCFHKIQNWANENVASNFQQETHGPHRPPEKTVQINIHI